MVGTYRWIAKTHPLVVTEHALIAGKLRVMANVNGPPETSPVGVEVAHQTCGIASRLHGQSPTLRYTGTPPSFDPKGTSHRFSYE